MNRKALAAAAAVLVLALAGAGYRIFVYRQPIPHRAQVAYPDEGVPYSVRVTRFRSADDAERSAARLRDDVGEPAFVAKITQGRSTWFEVHLGPWGDRAAAVEAAANAQKRGLTHAKVAEYAAYKKNLDEESMATARREKRALDPNEVDQQASVAQSLPPSIGEDLGATIRSFPVNHDLSVVEMGLVTPAGASSAGTVLTPYYFPAAVNESFVRGQTAGVVAVKFEDKLYGKRFSMLAAVPAEGDARAAAASLEAAVRTGYQAAGYTVSSERERLRVGNLDTEGVVMTAQKTGVTTIAFHVVGSTTRRAFFLIRSLSESGDEVRAALEDAAAGDAGLLDYAEVLRTLYALPGAETDRTTLHYFRLLLIGDAYVAEKGNADWAKAMLGYWEADFLLSDGGPYRVGIFDLRTTSYAGYVNKMYSDRMELGLRYGGNLRRVRVLGLPGWFVSLYAENEVNFGTGRYIVAVDGGAGAETLLARAEALQVFPSAKRELDTAPVVSGPVEVRRSRAAAKATPRAARKPEKSMFDVLDTTEL